VDANVPYLPSVTNLHKILDKMQTAGVPEVFNIDFLKDLGFTSSNDRPVIKLFKYLGLLDQSSRPQTAYREFVDHTKAKKVLAARLRKAFDDLYLSDREAHTRTVESLKGWFKTKTGEGDAVAKKIATTFRSLAQYADFSGQPLAAEKPAAGPSQDSPASTPSPAAAAPTAQVTSKTELGLVYRLEIHLPDTQNVETFRAIFKALREELMP
jgi:hypothetical protein